nr:hypothetical protein [Kibdelosporangium sp. MJ126-NF4]CTQ90401.1 hypothetical protein [Kibdelosporangium sp. MJ126-NF4]
MPSTSEPHGRGIPGLSRFASSAMRAERALRRCGGDGMSVAA